MTTYNGNIHYTDTRTGTPLKALLDRIFSSTPGTTPGTVLKGKIQGCSVKKVTVKYKATTIPRGIKTSTTDDACMTKLSLEFWNVIDTLKKSGPTGATSELSSLTKELKALKLSSGVTGTALATQAGKGPDPKLKWTYPAITGTAFTS